MFNLFKGNKKIMWTSVILLLLVFGIIMFFQINKPAPVIVPVSYTPALDATKVSPFAAINVVFSGPATLEDERNISLSISPNSNNSVLWRSDRKSIYFTTDSPLELSTQYQVTLINYNNKFTWGFTTASYSDLSQADLGRLQGIEDRAYAKSEQSFIDKYPWYTKIPPQNSDYFITFDSKNNTFYIYIYPKSSSGISQSAQVTNLENEAVQELKNIGVDLSLYKINWGITPQ